MSNLNSTTYTIALDGLAEGYRVGLTLPAMKLTRLIALACWGTDAWHNCPHADLLDDVDAIPLIASTSERSPLSVARLNDAARGNFRSWAAVRQGCLARYGEVAAALPQRPPRLTHEGRVSLASIAWAGLAIAAAERILGGGQH